ncbi:MAG: DUF3341 domain-containing protein [Balneolaceae bacterium]
MKRDYTDNNSIYGILAEFRNPAELLKAATEVSNSGYREFDTYSPFPVHGMDKAMKLKKSKLGWIVFAHGLTGFLGGLALIYFVMVVDYPLNISGKTFYNVPAWIPVIFEITILLSAFGAFFGLFWLCDLPRFNHPLFNSERFQKATNDGFFLCIEAADSQFEEEKVNQLLKGLGAVNTEQIDSGL